LKPHVHFLSFVFFFFFPLPFLSAIKEGFATFAGLKGVGVQEWRQAAETFVRDDMGRFVEDEFQLASLHEHFHRMLATAKGEAYVGARMAHDMQVQRVILLRVHVSPSRPCS
jgi:hypothetical protein